MRVAPEVRIDDELQVEVEVEFIGYDAAARHIYKRPALRHVKGRVPGSRRHLRESGASQNNS